MLQGLSLYAHLHCGSDAPEKSKRDFKEWRDWVAADCPSAVGVWWVETTSWKRGEFVFCCFVLFGNRVEGLLFDRFMPSRWKALTQRWMKGKPPSEPDGCDMFVYEPVSNMYLLQLYSILSADTSCEPREDGIKWPGHWWGLINPKGLKLYADRSIEDAKEYADRVLSVENWLYPTNDDGEPEVRLAAFRG